MKHFLIAAFVCFACNVNAQTHSLNQLWQTDSIIAIPESVLPDLKNKVLYVSLIDGGPWEADGKGGIGKLSLDGKSFDGNWITGMNAPKGLGIFGNRLYAADLNEVVVIDIKKGKIEKKISLSGAEGLNDITVTPKGIVYVSDSRTSKIWKIEKDIPSIYLEDIKGANGLRAIKEDLIFAQGKSLMKADAGKNLTKIAEVTEGIDGIEPVGNGDYVVSSWIGYIYYVKADGNFEILLDTHLQKINTADIGYDPKSRIVYVPTFMAKTVAAYQLK